LIAGTLTFAPPEGNAVVTLILGITVGVPVGTGLDVGVFKGGNGLPPLPPLLPPPPPPHAVIADAMRTAADHVPMRKNTRGFKPATVILEVLRLTGGTKACPIHLRRSGTIPEVDNRLAVAFAHKYKGRTKQACILERVREIGETRFLLNHPYRESECPKKTVGYPVNVSVPSLTSEM